MRLRVGCEFQFESEHEVAAVMLVRARADGEHHALHESQWAEPDLPIREFQDGFGNACWRLTFPGGPVTVRYDAVVDVEAEPDLTEPNARLAAPAELPDEVLAFTLPSRYVLATEDAILDPELQQRFAERIAAPVTRLGASHLVMVSCPEQVAHAIEAAGERLPAACS